MQKKFGLRGLCPHGDNGTTEFVPWSQWNGRACLRPHGVIGTAEVVSVPMESMVQPSLSLSPWSQWNGRVCLRPHGVIGTAEFVSVPMESMEQPSLSPSPWSHWNSRVCLRPHGVNGTAEFVSSESVQPTFQNFRTYDTNISAKSKPYSNMGMFYAQTCTDYIVV